MDCLLALQALRSSVGNKEDRCPSNRTAKEPQKCTDDHLAAPDLSNNSAHNSDEQQANPITNKFGQRISNDHGVCPTYSELDAATLTLDVTSVANLSIHSIPWFRPTFSLTFTMSTSASRIFLADTRDSICDSNELVSYVFKSVGTVVVGAVARHHCIFCLQRVFSSTEILRYQ